MTVNELGKTLKKMYELPGANKVAMIHLFGIIYGDEMRNLDIKPIEVIKAADMKESYFAEVNKGIKLSKYVELKDQYKKMF